MMFGFFCLVDVEQSYVRFLGNLILNLWDCGGQEAFMECYFAAQKDNIFKNVEVLIYVFDVQSQELDKVCFEPSNSLVEFLYVGSALLSILFGVNFTAFKSSEDLLFGT